MTYILAMVRRGVSTVLADSRVTAGTAVNSHDDMMKVGILFPGCIYGVAGSNEGLDPFLSDFKESVTSLGLDPIANWAYFAKYASAYYPHDHFQVVLSERTTGLPALHLYDSAQRGIVPCGTFVSLGSGKQFFDSYIRDWIDSNLGGIEEELIVRHGDTLLFPNFVCLALIEVAQGEESDFLNRQDVGVGGLFHYVVQTDSFERFQVPSVYLVLSPNRPKARDIYIRPFRICGSEYGLTLQGAPPFNVLPSLHLDTSKRWGSKMWSQEKWKEFASQALIQLNKLPFYHFLGICFAEKRYRGSLIVHTTFADDYVWDGEGAITPTYWRLVEEIFSAVDGGDQ